MPFAGTMTPASPVLTPPPAPGPLAAPPAQRAPALPPSTAEHMPVSATLAANEALAARRSRGEPVLPLAFGEAGLPAHPALQEALAAATASNGYGPVAGSAALRAAAAGYWQRRGLPTSPGSVVCGPGSKPLLFGLLLATGADVAVPRPSWVSYAAQAGLVGARAHFVPAAPGEGGICDPDALAAAVTSARAAGREIRSVVVTLPDNPTGRLPRPATVRAFCEVAAEHDLIIISDEIYRDLVHDPATPVLSPAAVAPQRTVVTTALSKSLAVGGWRIGVARLPEGPLGAWLRGQLVGIGSEIWSAPAAPIQQAAALAFSEPDDLLERVAPEPVPACQRVPGRGRHLPGRRARRAAAAGLVLRLPGLRAVARTTWPAATASPRVLAWPGCCSTATARERCRAARSASPTRRSGCGWPPACSTGRATSSRRRRWPPPTRWRCRGSRRSWPGWRRSSPTSRRDARVASRRDAAVGVCLPRVGAPAHWRTAAAWATLMACT